MTGHSQNDIRRVDSCSVASTSQVSFYALPDIREVQPSEPDAARSALVASGNCLPHVPLVARVPCACCVLGEGAGGSGFGVS